MKCSPDTRDCPLRRQSRHGRRPARRGVTVKTGIGSRDKDTGLCNPLYASRQRRPMPNLRQTVPRMFAAARSGCRRVFLCRCGQSAMIRCDDSLPTYGKRIGAYVQTHDTYSRSIYPYRKIYGQSIAVHARTYGRTIPMQALPYGHAGIQTWRYAGMKTWRHTAAFPQSAVPVQKRGVAAIKERTRKGLHTRSNTLIFQCLWKKNLFIWPFPPRRAERAKPRSRCWSPRTCTT